MSYVKPEVNILPSAVLIIHGGTSKSTSTMSDSTEKYFLTPPAYEADE